MAPIYDLRFTIYDLDVSALRAFLRSKCGCDGKNHRRMFVVRNSPRRPEAPDGDYLRWTTYDLSRAGKTAWHNSGRFIYNNRPEICFHTSSGVMSSTPPSETRLTEWGPRNTQRSLR